MSSSEPGRATLGAVGDIVLAGPTAAAVARDGVDWPFAEVLPLLRRADVLFGNLECAAAPPELPPDRLDPRGLVSPIDVGRVLAAAGFDVASIANNHVLDAGTAGLRHTVELLEGGGVRACGAAETQAAARAPVVLERAGLRWGFLCYGEDSNYTLSTSGPCYAYYVPEHVLADVARVRPTVDVLVVSVHADLEFRETPSPARREAFRAFAAAGATVVLGHHPHVQQGVELVGRSLVAYSLGNFVFHAHSSSYLRPHLPETARSSILLVELSRAGVLDWTRVPVSIAAPPDERPAPVPDDEARRLLERFAELDAAVADDARVAANWRAAALEQLVAESASPALSSRDPDALLRLLGRLLHVAENRAWVDEVAVAVAERWEAQRGHTDPYRRPSFASELYRDDVGARRSPVRRAASMLRRARSRRP